VLGIWYFEEGGREGRSDAESEGGTEGGSGRESEELREKVREEASNGGKKKEREEEREEKREKEHRFLMPHLSRRGDKRVEMGHRFRRGRSPLISSHMDVHSVRL
jgi:hypothetical protein